MPRTTPTGGPHVHVEEDEVAGGDIGNGDVAEPVDGVDGLRVAPGLLAVVAAHAVAFTLHVDNVKEEVEARGEVAAPDELLGLAQLVLVDEDSDAHGTRDEEEAVEQPRPSLEQVLEIEEPLCARREKDETESRCLRNKGNAIGMTRMVCIGNTLLESRANKLLYNVWLYNRNVACIPDHPSI